MLGLGEQVERHELGVGAAVGQHDALRWAGGQVDRHPAATARLAAVTHALPAPKILSTAGHRCGAVGQRRDRLGATGLEDPVDAADAGRDEHRAARSIRRGPAALR